MRLLPFLFSLTLFCSAFLSFSVQPILGKMLLPMVGGAPAGWIVAMAFFQTALLAGYGVSYALERFSIWIHLGGLVALYALGFLSLPIALPAIEHTAQGAALSLVVVTALFKAIFIPFLALTATTSALQRVFAATTHPTAKDPYYLFVASNAGSFIGLLCYPLILEIFYTLGQQGQFWRTIYVTVVLLIITSGLAAWRFRNAAPVKHHILAKTPISDRMIFTWLALAFVPCSLSMGVTTLITTDIAGVPLFWIIPLGLYLLTFILAFARTPVFTLKKLSQSHLNAVGFMVCILSLGLGFNPSGDMISFVIVAFLLLEIFFVIALFCHQKLASLRPSPDRLALFFFIVALGGCLAGIMHAFILPFTLNSVIEFPAMVLLSVILHREFTTPTHSDKIRKYILLTFLVVALAIATIILRERDVVNTIYIPVLAAFILAFLFISSRPRLVLIIGIIVFAGSLLSRYPGHVLEMGRNFFGAHGVYEITQDDKTTLRYFSHGNTHHGMAVYGGTDTQKYNSSYYSRQSPMGNAIRAMHAKTMGVIGLGAGQLACLDPKIAVDFYEIDERVVQIAKDYFPYLTECPVRNIYVGDGRLEIEKNKTRYDVLLLDAFTSDGIPIHIVTRDAIAMYRHHLKANGILLFHISNRYFELGHPIAAIAQAEGLQAYEIVHLPDGYKYPLALASRWAAIPMSNAMGQKLSAMGWIKIKPASTVWTDERSSLLSALNLAWFRGNSGVSH